jgi:hypothetical protein
MRFVGQGRLWVEYAETPHKLAKLNDVVLFYVEHVK